MFGYKVGHRAFGTGNDFTDKVVDGIRRHMETRVLGQRGGGVYCHNAGSGHLGEHNGVFGYGFALIRQVQGAQDLLQGRHDSSPCKRLHSGELYCGTAQERSLRLIRL